MADAGAGAPKPRRAICGPRLDADAAAPQLPAAVRIAAAIVRRPRERHPTGGAMIMRIVTADDIDRVLTLPTR